MSDNDNIFQILPGGKLPGGPEDTSDNDSLPVYDYIIVTNNGDEFPGSGFLIFTSHHVAIMKDNGKGAIPLVVVPLTDVKVAALAENLEQAAAELAF